MYYYNQHTNYDNTTSKSNYYNKHTGGQYQSAKNDSRNKNAKYNNNGCINNKSMNFANKFVDCNNQKYVDFESQSFSNNSSFSSSSPTNFLITENNQFYDNSYTRSLSSSFDDDSAYLSASLSSSTSSLEFSDMTYMGQPIWSSALYSPNLHPALFESWSAKMNKSIFQLNEELKHYDRINSEMVFNFDQNQNSDNMYINQVENLNFMNDLYNQRQQYINNNKNNNSYKQQQQYQQQTTFYPMQFPTTSEYNNSSHNISVGDTTNLISYEEMTTKVDDLLNPSVNQENLESAKSLKDITNKSNNSFQNVIHISTSSESLEQDIDSKSRKSSVSPKLKFTAPRFEKKWLKQTQATTTQATPTIKQCIQQSSYQTPTYNSSCQNMTEFTPSTQKHKTSTNCSPPQMKYYSNNKKGSEQATQGRHNNLSHGNNNNNRWNSNSVNKNNNNQAPFKYNHNNNKSSTSNHAQNNNSNKSGNCGYSNNVNENENSTGGYNRARNNKHNNNNTNRYRYRASSKSRA